MAVSLIWEEVNWWAHYFTMGNFCVFQSVSSPFCGFFGRFLCVCVCVFEDCFPFYTAFRLGKISSVLHHILAISLSLKHCWLLRPGGRASLNRKPRGRWGPAWESTTCQAVKAVWGGLVEGGAGCPGSTEHPPSVPRAEHWVDLGLKN